MSDNVPAVAELAPSCRVCTRHRVIRPVRSEASYVLGQLGRRPPQAAGAGNPACYLQSRSHTYAGLLLTERVGIAP